MTKTKTETKEFVRMKLIVNDQPVDMVVKSGRRLIDFIRDDLHLTGTKEGCSEGECGSCTILLDGRSVLSCLIPVEYANGRVIRTIEGVGSSNSPHPLQESMVEEGAIQCGFCTPGMVMSGIYLLSKNPTPSREEIIKGISGNLCRCTGYQKIIRAIDKAAKKMNK
jgi:aerobic-type carbon monoxide dehydrogenase small subunit (CoxS/CutS family)